MAERRDRAVEGDGEPIVTVAPRLRGGPLWTPVRSFTVAVVLLCVVLPPVGLLLALSLPVVYGLSALRFSRMDFRFYPDRVVGTTGLTPFTLDRTTVRYDEVAFAVSEENTVSSTHNVYVVHEDGALELPFLGDADAETVEEVLGDRVPPKARRARGTDRDTARWLVYDRLDDADGVVLSRRDVVEILDLRESGHAIDPAHFGSIDGVQSVEDVYRSDLGGGSQYTGGGSRRSRRRTGPRRTRHDGGAPDERRVDRLPYRATAPTRPVRRRRCSWPMAGPDRASSPGRGRPPARAGRR